MIITGPPAAPTVEGIVTGACRYALGSEDRTDQAGIADVAA
jgi:hypothetical protein